MEEWSEMKLIFFFFFFFQAEDGIRDIGVTGVQTCALPIYNKIIKTIFKFFLQLKKMKGKHFFPEFSPALQKS